MSDVKRHPDDLGYGEHALCYQVAMPGGNNVTFYRKADAEKLKRQMKQSGVVVHVVEVYIYESFKDYSLGL